MLRVVEMETSITRYASHHLLPSPTDTLFHLVSVPSAIYDSEDVRPMNLIVEQPGLEGMILRNLAKEISHRHFSSYWRDFFYSMGIVFTITIGWNEFIKKPRFSGAGEFWAIVVISLGFAVKRAWRPKEIEIRIAHTDTKIEILFGDLFQVDGVRAIAVNEFFDSKIGRPVSINSLHGILIKEKIGGGPEYFDQQVEKQLETTHGDEVEKAEGKTKKYPIGTTVLIKANDDQYLIFAMSHTDPTTCKASSDVGTAWVALHSLWARARSDLDGNTLNLPLVGSGLSGLGLPTRDLLNLIILSVISATKVKKIGSKVRIVLHEDVFDEIDLRDIKAHWEE